MLNPLQPLRAPLPPHPARSATFPAAAAPLDRVDLQGDRAPAAWQSCERLAGGRDGIVRHAMSSAFRADLESGMAPADSEAGLRRLDEALNAKRTLWDWQVAPVFDAYAQHFAGRPEGLDLLVFLAGKQISGTDAAAIAAELARPVEGLPLQRRTELFGRLLEAADDAEAALVGWTLLRSELEAGRDGGAAVERVRLLTEGLRKAGMRHDFQQKPVLEACREHLAAAPALLPGWPLRLLKERVSGDDLVEAVAEAGKVLGPLLRGASPALEGAVLAALESPSKGSWKADLEALREILSMVAGPGEEGGTIGEEEAWVLIGDVSLPKRGAR